MAKIQTSMVLLSDPPELLFVQPCSIALAALCTSLRNRFSCSLSFKNSPMAMIGRDLKIDCDFLMLFVNAVLTPPTD